MAPTKKRERETAAVAATSTSSGAVNGAGNSSSVNNSGGGNTTATTPTTSTTINGTNAQNPTMENVKLNGHQQEQELFLQAFEKPTQIYRYLRERQYTYPIFLNRTLNYMKDRMSRNNRKRATFKVDSILNTVVNRTESNVMNYVNIIFNGLFSKSSDDEDLWHDGDAVCVETMLFKITKSKRKESTSDFQEIINFKTNVIYNPHDDINELNTISIPVQDLQPFRDQHSIYKLLFRIKITPGSDNQIHENGFKDDVPAKRNKTSNNNTNFRFYSCELILYEKNIGYIQNGDYEGALYELNSSHLKAFSPKKRTWETLPPDYIPLTAKFDVFNKTPTLKFRLVWSSNEVPAQINASEFHEFGAFAKTTKEKDGLVNGNSIDGDENSTTKINHNNNCIKNNAKTEKIHIVYNFLYNNNTCQQTEYTQEVLCPWCNLDCLRLYALLKHLKLCHARFNFTYQPAGKGARIDVTINDAFDGSYAGSPYDLASPSGYCFARSCGPVRRTTMTSLLVCRPRRSKPVLDEFLVLDEEDISNQRSYITGHNRLYHHTETCLPVHPKELDIDSEGESDPPWLRQKTVQMIDEFSDVNEGEKELMKLWNLHIMKHGFVGDCQLPLACEMFLDANGHEIIRKNLYRNFILHISSLFDYGLISAENVFKTVQKLQGILSKYAEGQAIMSEQREKQLKYWQEVGRHKHEEQKLKSPLKQITAATSTLATTSASAAATLLTATNTANKNDIKGKIKTTTSNTQITDTDRKLMHPPMKRASIGVKRNSLTTQNGHTTANGSSGDSNDIKLNNLRTPNKKTVTKLIKDPSSMILERRTINGLRRSSSSLETSKTRGRISLERSRSFNEEKLQQTSKRKNSNKDLGQPNAKRRRYELAAAAATAKSTTTRRSSVTNNKATLPQRLVRRRQTIALSTNNSTNSSDATVTRSSKTTSTTTTTTLRTRLSLPLAKTDKR